MSTIETGLREGPRVTRMPKAAGGTSFTLRWGIVREIVHPADSTVIIEFARKGRNYESEDPKDYHRWVGEHEYMRSGGTPPFLPIDDYLHEVDIPPHWQASLFNGYLCPPITDDPDPYYYRDTDVETTKLVMLFGQGSALMVVPVPPYFTQYVDSAARAHECIVEA